MTWPRPHNWSGYSQGQIGDPEERLGGAEGMEGAPMSATKPLQLQLGAVELGQADEEASESALGKENGLGFTQFRIGTRPARPSPRRPARQPIRPGRKPRPPAD